MMERYMITKIELSQEAAMDYLETAGAEVRTTHDTGASFLHFGRRPDGTGFMLLDQTDGRAFLFELS